MSRRPRTAIEQRVSRRLDTMAPGGRIPSESPVRRVKGTMGGGAPFAVTLRGDFSGHNPPVGETEVGVDVFDYVVGDVFVTWASTWGAANTWSSPAGWTDLDSGASGDLGYLVSARRITGTDDLTFTLASPYASGTGVSLAGWILATPPAGLPTVTVAESSGTSVTLPTPSGALWNGLLVGGANTDYPTDFEWGGTFDGAPSRDMYPAYAGVPPAPVFMYGAVGAGVDWYGAFPTDWDSLPYNGRLDVVAGTVSTPNGSSDWATLAFGWA